jgi:K+ transporter
LKIPTGGYVPLIIATVSFAVMYIWKSGKEAFHKASKDKTVSCN